MGWKKNCVGLLGLLLSVACGNDDGLNIQVVPPEPLSDVLAEDDAAIRDFLSTHFYNYEEFETPPADFDFRIVIDTIAGDNASKIPLIDQVQTAQITVRSEEFNLEDAPDVTHNLYYLEALEGGGDAPTVADSAFVAYRGTLLDGRDFDGSFSQPVWFDLARLQGPLQGARGFTEGMRFFKAATGITVNPDGTLSAQNQGVGLIIMPSGLGFYNRPPQGSVIAAYSPLIFTVEVFAVDQTDHDGDGIPSIQEDLNGDGYLYNDNTNESEERSAFGGVLTVNFLDNDDDGDDTPTREEIIINPDGSITFPDTDGDGIPDYLDKDNS
jgi:hypothetical protein